MHITNVMFMMHPLLQLMLQCCDIQCIVKWGLPSVAQDHAAVTAVNAATASCGFQLSLSRLS